MTIDGRAISKEILEGVRNAGCDAHVRAVAVAPNAATRSYLRIKRRAAEAAGMTLEVVELPAAARAEEVVAAIQAPGADAVIVQLPLPTSLDTAEILEYIPALKDADALSRCALVLPPVGLAVQEVMQRAQVDVRGKLAVVIGKGRLVGQPVKSYLGHMGATVSVFDEDDFAPYVLSDADIIVSGAGVPHLVKPEMVKEGVVLIDAGTSEQGGTIVGDIDPACAAKASVYTPVPGGIGPIAVAMLFRNVLSLRQYQ